MAAQGVNGNPPRIAILGAGAVGQLLCHQLTQAGARVGLIARPGSGQADRVTLDFTSLDNSRYQHSVALLPQDADAVKDLDLLLVCVKAYQVVDALTPLLPRLAADCQLVLMHNGMGPYLTLLPKLAGRGLTLATTSQGALRQGQWQVTQTGPGLTQLGWIHGPVMSEQHRALLLGAIPDSQWCEAILPALWQKLAVNAVINPLTAIYECRNGELRRESFRPLRESVLQELIQVAAADGIALDAHALGERLASVIALTANNYSSMHQDLAHGRRTEIEEINGFILSRAALHGIAAPTNLRLYREIKRLQALSGQ
ncbi:ketopantoate reductase family protein [Shewanella salipaludis]|uniref:2-dehydropantoate 2-reductase n=1 Tax=Shewanella salipaludis TaxID=2723052 RepID=A0A972G9F6_9GAMM|nr:2-dehydropantoate 2-reductase [Shewanella salipaludis]NMH67005.1 2-dehydropantoate 2-reductase [Shewanella salipaludis]